MVPDVTRFRKSAYQIYSLIPTLTSIFQFYRKAIKLCLNVVHPVKKKLQFIKRVRKQKIKCPYLVLIGSKYSWRSSFLIGSTNRQNPTIQQKLRNFWTSNVIWMLFGIKNLLTNCNIGPFMTESPISNHQGVVVS